MSGLRQYPTGAPQQLPEVSVRAADNDDLRAHRDQLITEFRYQLVAELANPYLSATKRRGIDPAEGPATARGAAPRSASLFSGLHPQVAGLYRKHGRAGLAPRPRRDAGRARSLSDTEAAVFLNYLETHPELTASAALRTLQTDGRITGTPSSSAPSGLVRSAGLHRTARQRQAHGEQHLKFEFFAPLECVQADFMYGPRLPTPQRSAPSHPPARVPRRRHPPNCLRHLGIQRVRGRLRSRHP